MEGRHAMVMTKTYRFRADLCCHLANGDVTVLRGYVVRVEAMNRQEASRHLKAVATEMVHAAGGELLDAPLDYLTIAAARVEPW
jgi:hypothetical protein